MAVVGSGVTGLSCALTLAEHGRRVRVHEARTVASGASGRNGGFALGGGAMPYHVARDELGPERARWLWGLAERALDRMEGLAGDALRRVGSLWLAADEQERSELLEEHAALVEDGFAAEWIDEPAGALAGRYLGAILHPRDGSLQPARWVRRLAAHAAAAGAEIREHDHVDSIDSLDADAVVVASDGYPSGLLPAIDAVVQPTRGQVIVTEPLDELLYDRPHYARHGFDYWQQLPDRRLVLGGRRDRDLDAEIDRRRGDDADDPGRAGGVRHGARRHEADDHAPLVRHLRVDADRLPLVGPVPGQDGAWVARGYSGHGNVLGLACGELVANAVLGRGEPELELFDPARLL